MGPSAVVEDYLKAIYILEAEVEDRVRTSELADYLDVTAPTVTSMLANLDEQGLVAYEKYKGVSLTAPGKRVALETIRHHRLLEAYLTEQLDFPWADVHEEADRLEHHISEDLETRVAAALDEPERDPHGDPIPNASLDPPDENAGDALSDFGEDATVVVERVSDRDPATLEYLAQHGIRPGAVVRIREVAPFGLYTLAPEPNEDPVSIPADVAEDVRVAAVEAA